MNAIFRIWNSLLDGLTDRERPYQIDVQSSTDVVGMVRIGRPSARVQIVSYRIGDNSDPPILTITECSLRQAQQAVTLLENCARCVVEIELKSVILAPGGKR